MPCIKTLIPTHKIEKQNQQSSVSYSDDLLITMCRVRGSTTLYYMHDVMFLHISTQVRVPLRSSFSCSFSQVPLNATKREREELADIEGARYATWEPIVAAANQRRDTFLSLVRRSIFGTVVFTLCNLSHNLCIIFSESTANQFEKRQSIALSIDNCCTIYLERMLTLLIGTLFATTFDYLIGKD